MWNRDSPVSDVSLQFINFPFFLHTVYDSQYNKQFLRKAAETDTNFLNQLSTVPQLWEILHVLKKTVIMVQYLELFKYANHIRD
jgi:hypothetical protein